MITNPMLEGAFAGTDPLNGIVFAIMPNGSLRTVLAYDTPTGTAVIPAMLSVQTAVDGPVTTQILNSTAHASGSVSFTVRTLNAVASFVVSNALGLIVGSATNHPTYVQAHGVIAALFTGGALTLFDSAASARTVIKPVNVNGDLPAGVEYSSLGAGPLILRGRSDTNAVDGGVVLAYTIATQGQKIAARVMNTAGAALGVFEMMPAGGEVRMGASAHATLAIGADPYAAWASAAFTHLRVNGPGLFVPSSTGGNGALIVRRLSGVSAFAGIEFVSHTFSSVQAFVGMDYANNRLWLNADGAGMSVVLATQGAGRLAVHADRVEVNALWLTAATVAGAASAGSASALPSNPDGYLVVRIGGVDKKVPYYAM